MLSFEHVINKSILKELIMGILHSSNFGVYFMLLTYLTAD